MNIVTTPLKDAYVIEPPCFPDARGYFSFFFNEEQFNAATVTEQYTMAVPQLAAAINSNLEPLETLKTALEQPQSVSLNTKWVQTNKVLNHQAGILRGLHYQQAPYAEVKLITCVAGSVFDVIVDIRPDSPTKYQWFGTVLSAENQKVMYVPKGFAHGYQTLQDDTMVLYQVSDHYNPQASDGFMWDEPQFGIQWPLSKTPLLSERDKEWAYL